LKTNNNLCDHGSNLCVFAVKDLTAKNAENTPRTPRKMNILDHRPDYNLRELCEGNFFTASPEQDGLSGFYKLNSFNNQ